MFLESNKEPRPIRAVPLPLQRAKYSEHLTSSTLSDCFRNSGNPAQVPGGQDTGRTSRLDYGNVCISDKTHWLRYVGVQ